MMAQLQFRDAFWVSGVAGDGEFVEQVQSGINDLGGRHRDAVPFS